MMELFRLLGTIVIDNSEANNDMDETTGKAEKSESKISGAFKKIGAAVVTFFAVDKIIQFGKACIDSASNVQEMENKFDVVFKGMTEEVDSWAASYATAIGRNKNTIKEYLSDNQNMFVGMGMTREAGAKLSEQMVSLGLDLASFNNLSEDDAVNALSKAIMGESEAAKTLGAVLNDNTLALAMNTMGIQGKFDALTESEKMEVRYQAILMQSSDAVGDCERSLDSYKGRQIQLQSALENTKEKLGGLLLPIATLGTTFLVTGVNGLQSFIDTMSNGESRAAFFESAMNKAFSPGFITRVQEWIPHMQEITQIFAQNTADVFAGKIGGVKDAFSALRDIIQPLVETWLSNVMTSFETLATLWNTIFLPIISFVMDAFLELTTTILTAIAPAIQSISDKFQELRQLVMDAVQTYILPTIQSFVDMIKQLWAENQDKINLIGELFKTIFQAIADLVGWFVEVFKNYISPFLEWLSSTIQANMDSIKGIFQAVFDVIGGIVSFFIALFKGDWSGMWDAVKSILTGAKDFVVNVFNTLAGVLGSVVSSIVNAVSGAFENIRTGMQEKISAAKDVVLAIFDGIKNGISEKISAAADFVSGIIDNIKGFFKFDFELPKIKLPHFSLKPAGWDIGDLLKGSIPSLGIEWFAKGGVMNQPTAFGINPATGKVMAGGEAGAEAIAPISTLQQYVAEAVAGQNAELVSTLNLILQAIYSMDEGLGQQLFNALLNMKFEINNREFARLVKAV